jgi:hypothetical protein
MEEAGGGGGSYLLAPTTIEATVAPVAEAEMGEDLAAAAVIKGLEVGRDGRRDADVGRDIGVSSKCKTGRRLRKDSQI